MRSFLSIMSPDWIMVIITAFYVIFTCIIMVANRKSVIISKEQLEESRKQFDKLQSQNETLKQLNFMPFFAIGKD